jgi:hypothetical protein
MEPSLPCQHTDDVTRLIDTHIDTEAQLEHLQLWLPIDRPIITGRGGLLAGTGLLSVLAAIGFALSIESLLLGSLVMNTNQILLLMIVILIMVSLIALTTRDVVERLGERLVDRYRPIRSRRERLTLTQRMLRSDEFELSLDSVQAVSLEQQRFTTTLSARTQLGDIIIAQHSSKAAMKALGTVIAKQAERCRQGARESGQDPDRPGAIPHRLEALRLSST